jgi:hypothetical protein
VFDSSAENRNLSHAVAAFQESTTSPTSKISRNMLSVRSFNTTRLPAGLNRGVERVSAGGRREHLMGRSAPSERIAQCALAESASGADPSAEAGRILGGTAARTLGRDADLIVSDTAVTTRVTLLRRILARPAATSRAALTGLDAPSSARAHGHAPRTVRPRRARYLRWLAMLQLLCRFPLDLRAVPTDERCALLATALPVRKFGSHSPSD